MCSEGIFWFFFFSFSDMLFNYYHKNNFKVSVVSFLGCINVLVFLPALQSVECSLFVFWCSIWIFFPPRGHEAYLRTGPHYDFEHYKQLVHEITQAFSGISREVLQIKERLQQQFDRADLSEHIEKLQSSEKEKLQLVGDAQSGHSDSSSKSCQSVLSFVVIWIQILTLSSFGEDVENTEKWRKESLVNFKSEKK